ncbi:MAG: hypothetical protein LBC88_03405 [Spirochaetaceae bacterium]|nr:hypothetical protein [Spirochaetaceae bacterium]
MFVLAALVFPALPAEETGGASGAAPDVSGAMSPVPLIPVLAAAHRGAALWRPDWPLSFPPDAFMVRGASSVTLITEEGEYRFRRDRAGIAREFPFPFPDGFHQVSFIEDASRQDASRQDAGRYTGFRVSAPGGETLWTVEFLAFQDDDPALPSLCRVFGGGERGVWYFAALEYRGGRAGETWYGETGEAAGVFTYTFAPGSPEPFPPLYRTEWASLAAGLSPEPDGNAAGETVSSPVLYFYDSFGMVSGIAAPGSDYSARFGDGLPRYWNRPVPVPRQDASHQDAPRPVDTPRLGAPALTGEPSAPQDARSPDASRLDAPIPGVLTPSVLTPSVFRFQWDENSLLRRFSGMSVDGGLTFDSRFDYGHDGRGNWTERRETVLARRAGYLVPTGARIIRRRAVYGDAE